jgi:hypothetical protein
MTSPSSLLPPRARAKLARLSADVTDARALLNALQENSKVAEHAVMQATHNLEVADHHDADHYRRLLANLNSAEAARAAVERKRSARQAALAAAERQLQPILGWLEQFRYGPVGDREVFVDSDADVTPELGEGETYQDAVDRVRTEFYAVRNQIAEIKAAPLPFAEVKASIEAQVKNMAEGGVPTVSVANGTTRVQWPGDAARFSDSNLAHWRALCWMHTQPIVDFLTAQAEASIGTSGIPYAERAPRIAELERRLPPLELQEEALIEAAAAEDIIIPRRGDASPMAILMMAWPAHDATPSANDDDEVSSVAAE